MEKANERGRFEKKPGYRECRKICLQFIQADDARRQETSFLWKLMKFTFVLTAILVATDLYSNKGYTGSRTSIVLKKYGIEEKLIIGYQYVDEKRILATSYVATHAPMYYAKISPYVDPVIEKTGYYIRITIEAIYKYSKPIRDFANTHIPPLLEKVTYFLRRQYEIISSFLSNLYQTYIPIIQENVLGIYNWLRVSLPKAYRYVSNVLMQLKKAIYDLNPAMFDKAGVVINDAIDYIIKMVPVIVERSMVTLNLLLEAIRSYLVKGQGWMQQQFSSVPDAKKT